MKEDKNKKNTLHVLGQTSSLMQLAKSHQSNVTSTGHMKEYPIVWWQDNCPSTMGFTSSDYQRSSWRHGVK